MWIIGMQKLQKMFDHLNNFYSYVVLKDEKFNIKCIQSIKSIISMFNLNFQNLCQSNTCIESIK